MSAHPTPLALADRVAFLAGTLLLAHECGMSVSRESLAKLHRAAFDLKNALSVRLVEPLPERRHPLPQGAELASTSEKALAYIPRACHCTSTEQPCALCSAEARAT